MHPLMVADHSSIGRQLAWRRLLGRGRRLQEHLRMGKKGKRKKRKRRTTCGASVDEFNQRLEKLRKRAKKAVKGKGGARAHVALRRWSELQDLGLKPSCCGKSEYKLCKSCPRHGAALVLAPLKAG